MDAALIRATSVLVRVEREETVVPPTPDVGSPLPMYIPFPEADRLSVSSGGTVVEGDEEDSLSEDDSEIQTEEELDATHPDVMEITREEFLGDRAESPEL